MIVARKIKTDYKRREHAQARALIYRYIIFRRCVRAPVEGCASPLPHNPPLAPDDTSFSDDPKISSSDGNQVWQ